MIDTILDPQIWLVLVAVVHAVVGVILPTEWEDDTNKLVSGWFLLTTVTMLGSAFLLEGEAMARMAVVIAGPVWVWFVVCIALGLEITYTTDGPYTFDFADNVPPLIFWGMTALTGVLGWNMEEE